ADRSYGVMRQRSFADEHQNTSGCISSLVHRERPPARVLPGQLISASYRLGGPVIATLPDDMSVAHAHGSASARPPLGAGFHPMTCLFSGSDRKATRVAIIRFVRVNQDGDNNANANTDASL